MVWGDKGVRENPCVLALDSLIYLKSPLNSTNVTFSTSIDVL